MRLNSRIFAQSCLTHTTVLKNAHLYKSCAVCVEALYDRGVFLPRGMKGQLGESPSVKAEAQQNEKQNIVHYLLLQLT